MRSEGSDLRRSRVGAGLSRQDVADICGLPVEQIRSVERDHPISPRHVHEVRAALDWNLRNTPRRRAPAPRPPEEVPMGLSAWAKDVVLVAQGVTVACGAILVGLAATRHPAAFVMEGVELAVLVPALAVVALWVLRRPFMLLPLMTATTWSCTLGAFFLYETLRLAATSRDAMVSVAIQAPVVAASGIGLLSILRGVRNRFSPILS